MQQPADFMSEPIMSGLVVKNTGSWYMVKTDSGSLVECKVKGNFRIKGIKSTNPVAVGDHVDIKVNAGGTALITAIHDRRNYIVRKPSNLSKQLHVIGANLDQSFLVVTVSHPETPLEFIDRFLATSEAYRVPATLVINKADLYDEAERGVMHAMQHLYSGIGYECRVVSAVTGEGMDRLREALAGRVTLFSGNSGVGKSTLLTSRPCTTRGCTRRHSLRCLTPATEAISSTPRASRASARLTCAVKRWGTISPRYSARLPGADMGIACICMSRDVPSRPPSRRAA